MNQIEVISNKLNMPSSSYSVSSDEFAMIRSIHSWISTK